MKDNSLAAEGANNHNKPCNHYMLGGGHRLKDPSCVQKVTGVIFPSESNISNILKGQVLRISLGSIQPET